jgi:hypothetical protein
MNKTRKKLIMKFNEMQKFIKKDTLFIRACHDIQSAHNVDIVSRNIIAQIPRYDEMKIVLGFKFYPNET